MSPAAARQLEYMIIGLGVLALVADLPALQHLRFSPSAAALSCWRALINNLLPLAQPGVPVRSVVTAALVVAMIFCIVLLVSIFAAHLYGVFFLKPPNPNTVTGKIQLNATPWYMHHFTWTIAAIAAVLAGLVTLQSRRKD